MIRKIIKNKVKLKSILLHAKKIDNLKKDNKMHLKLFKGKYLPCLWR